MAMAATTTRKMPMRTSAPTTKTPAFSSVPSASSMASPRLPAPESHPATSHLVTHRAVVEVEGLLPVALPTGQPGLHPVVRHHLGLLRRALPEDPEGRRVARGAASRRLRR